MPTVSMPSLPRSLDDAAAVWPAALRRLLACASLLFAVAVTPQTPQSPAPPKAAGQASQPSTFEFSDEPGFQVAGITDWTAVGGHGADITLRASEELARDTSADPQPAAALPLDPHQEATLRTALTSHPDAYEPNRDLGALYLHAHRFQAALPYLQTAASLHNDAPEDEFALAQACAGLNDLPAAQQHLAQALQQQPNDARLHHFAAELAERQGNPLEAVNQFQRAAQLQPTEANFLAWGSELLVHRAIWQAAEVFSNAAKLFPAAARLQAAWGAALFAGARYDDASLHLCHAAALEPRTREPYLLLGKAILGSPAPLPCATEALSRFRQLYPDDPDANFYLAMQALKSPTPTTGPQPEALLRRAVTLQPSYAPAWLQLGILATAAHNTDEALRDFQRASAADPQLAEAHYRLGVLYDRAGKTADAQREFATHEALQKQQAEAVEQARRQIKQFTMLPAASASQK